MKKPSASRLKKLPLLLGTLLIISVAAYGTRAYFSDSRTQQANIELVLGDVEISTDKTKEWEYTPLETGFNLDASEAKNKRLGKSKQDANVVYTNVRPGDSFTREYVIENTGSLDVKVGLDYSGQFSQSPLPNKLEGAEINIPNIEVENTPFLISISGLQTNFTLEPKGTEKYIVTITVDEEANNDFNINNKKTDDLDKFTSDFLEETLSIKAVQTNAENITSVD